MKRLFILLILISYIYCSTDSCENESDQSKCESHAVEFNGFSCYKFKDDYEKGCTVYPDKAESQKAAFKFVNGMQKEISSGYIKEDLDFDKMELYSANKETYSKGEEIVLNEVKLTSEDKRILTSKKTCSYQYYGRFVDYVYNLVDYRNYNGYPNIEDKNVCFNVEQFPDLTDLIDCGYAEIKFRVTNDKQYIIKTCFYIPDNNMPEDFGAYLKKNFIDDIIFNGIMPSLFYSIESLDSQLDSQIRRLDASKYEVIVEDKNGKKVKYTSGSSEIEILEKGNNYFHCLKLNIILLLSLLFLIH